jgi:polysaccharide pyruvyl transferase WcaK-like protein
VRRHYKKRPERCRKHLLIAGSVAWRDDSLSALIQYIQNMRKQGFSISILFGANLMPAADDITFIDAFRRVYPDDWRLIKAASIYEWLDAIAGATILVSGRFHHTIAAWCLSTPFLLLDSNTPKNSGLAEILQAGSPLPHGLPNLTERLLLDTESILKNPLDVNREEKMEKLCALAMQNFAGIRRGDSY